MGMPIAGSPRSQLSAARAAERALRAPRGASSPDPATRAGLAPARGALIGALVGLGLWIALGAGLLLAL